MVATAVFIVGCTVGAAPALARPRSVVEPVSRPNGLAVRWTNPVPAHAQDGSSISGIVGYGNSGQSLAGICIVFYSTVGTPTWSGSTQSGPDGTFSFTPAMAENYDLAVFAPSTAGNCNSLPLSSNPVPAWFQDVALTPADPHNLTVPGGVQDVPTGTSGLTVCLGTDSLFTGGCQILPTGTGAISGRVVTTGAQPVPNACVFVLPKGLSSVYGPVLTAPDGTYLVHGLPLDLDLVVAFVPPFSTDQGPCQSNGPPPPPGPGQLQPVFWKDAWFDLTAFTGSSQPFDVALPFSPTVLRASATGVDGCLTTAPADVVPRPSCVEAASPILAAPRFTG